jgi:hypothetical protein
MAHQLFKSSQDSKNIIPAARIPTKKAIPEAQILIKMGENPPFW